MNGQIEKRIRDKDILALSGSIRALGEIEFAKDVACELGISMGSLYHQPDQAFS